MAVGGKREGAGRKPGTANVKTREIANKALEQGITPLEVMLNAMRDAYNKAEYKDAAAYAKDAAPYVHPRLAAVEHAGPGGGPIQHSVEVLFVGDDDD